MRLALTWSTLEQRRPRLRLSARRAPPINVLRKAAHFTGGVPRLVDAVSARCQSDASLPDEDDALLASMGSVVDEIRGAVDIVHMDSALADRLYELAPGDTLPRASEVDDALTMAGWFDP